MANFYIGRFIVGIGSGMNLTLIPIYIKEMSPDAINYETGDFGIEPIIPN